MHLAVRTAFHLVRKPLADIHLFVQARLGEAVMAVVFQVLQPLQYCLVEAADGVEAGLVVDIGLGFAGQDGLGVRALYLHEHLLRLPAQRLERDGEAGVHAHRQRPDS